MNEINAITEKFEYIKTMRTKVSAIFQDVKQKIGYLNKIYSDIVKNHSMKEYTFGLDSFYFQTRVIELEHDNLNKMLNILTNRFYCEYYKLYKIIEEYINIDINDVKLNDKFVNKKVFPVYKDLDKNANYDFSLTIEIQRSIVKYITDLCDYLRIKNIELKDNTKHSKLGINIENIVNYQHFSIALLNERIVMFVRYLEALNKHHTKYINRLFVSSKSMIDAVNEDIMTKQFNNDHTISPAENVDANKNPFETNDKILYSIVEEDFTVIDKGANEIANANANAIAQNEIGQNANEIGQNANEIGQNANEIAQNANEIAQNANEIGQNANEIGQNEIATEKILHRSISDFDLDQL